MDHSSQSMQSHHADMMRQHTSHLWCQFACMLIGVWLLTSPVSLGSLDPANVGVRVAEVTRDRSLAPIEMRQAWLAWSDMASGAALLVFASLSLVWRHRWAQWGTCAVGLWLISAPILLWAPSPAVYLNDTLTGAFAIALSILVPMMPGMDMKAMMAPEDIPPGWDYSPSSWSQRLPIIALAFVGFFIARYLSAYQLGHIASVWDPFFGDSTRTIITSDVSKAWPMPDAGLGALSYLLEALSGMMGGRQRWRTMPWMVGMFGVLVIPLGAVSIFFIVIQPILIGTWCTLCLVSAAAMVAMLPYAFDEIVAMCQFMKRAKQEGQPMWRVFWRGGTVQGARTDPSPPLTVGWSGREALATWMEAAPKGLIVSAALGVWLMFSRLVLGHAGLMADSDHLVGAMVFTISVCAFAEVARPLRFVNVPLALWLIASPWCLDGATTAGLIATTVCGAALIVLSLPRGAVRHAYSAWDGVLTW